MSAAPKHMVQRAVEVINEVFPDAEAAIMQPGSKYNGYIDIILNGYVDSVLVVNSGTVFGALPRRTWLEPINAVSLRLVRA